jgi:hypothetical protein
VTGSAVNTGNTDGAAATSTATCPAGTKLLGGGARITETGNTKAAVSASFPSGASVWTATSLVTTGGNGQAQIAAYAICGQ